MPKLHHSAVYRGKHCDGGLRLSDAEENFLGSKAGSVRCFGTTELRGNLDVVVTT